jgi:hypothetical protein
MDNLKRTGTGICFILLPLILIFGFAGHPNLTDLKPPGSNIDNWVREFHDNSTWRVVHVAVLWVTIPITIYFLGACGCSKIKRRCYRS